jgi:enoyl-CoA hydratase/carnithine racemase
MGERPEAMRGTMIPEHAIFRLRDLADPTNLPDVPVAFVDLSREEAGFGAGLSALPAMPVIGLGPCDHPLSARLDAVLEPRFTAEALFRSISAKPLAARVVTQLLRLLPHLPDEEALNAESLAYATLQGSEAHRRWIAARSCGAAAAAGRVRLSREDDVLTVTLDRAEAGNAIDRAMRDALHEAFALANADTTITRVILRGEGRAFSLGAELSEFGTTTDPATAHAIRCATLPAREAVRCADRLEVHVDGACVGSGLELAAFARRITATPRSWFQLPELAMGILPGAGGCVSLSRRIGRQRTLLMVLGGRRLGAREALDWGLVDALVDDPA